MDEVKGRVRKRVADEVREELVVQVREELKPDLDRVEEERNRIRDEERAVLQRQYHELAEKRQEIEEERLQVREEEMARVRVEFATNVGAENAAPVGGDGAVEGGAPDEVEVVDQVVAAPAAGVEEEPLVEAVGAVAGDFDMEAFLAVSGYGVVSLGGELEGDEGVREPVAMFEPVGGGGVVAEPDGVQEEMDDPPGASKTGISGLWTLICTCRRLLFKAVNRASGPFWPVSRGLGNWGWESLWSWKKTGVTGRRTPACRARSSI